MEHPRVPFSNAIRAGFPAVSKYLQVPCNHFEFGAGALAMTFGFRGKFKK